MAVKWNPTWNNGNNNDVDPSLGKEDILHIIRSMPDYIQKVQEAACREAIQLVKDDSSNVTIIKGLHQIGTEHITIKKTGNGGGPSVHLFCMNYTLVESDLRTGFDDMIRGATGWRVTSASDFNDGSNAIQGMDKTGEIDTSSRRKKTNSQAAFAEKHYF